MYRNVDRLSLLVYVEDCWERVPTLANLGNNHGFISKEYISIGTRLLGEPKAKP